MKRKVFAAAIMAGIMAAAMTQGVQSVPGTGTTIKHVGPLIFCQRAPCIATAVADAQGAPVFKVAGISVAIHRVMYSVVCGSGAPAEEFNGAVGRYGLVASDGVVGCDIADVVPLVRGKRPCPICTAVGCGGLQVALRECNIQTA